MRIVVNPRVRANAGPKANTYHNRRLVYQAEILRRAGYDVSIDLKEASRIIASPDAAKLLNGLPPAADNAIASMGPDDIYLCSVGYLMLNGKSPDDATIIAWNDSLSCTRGVSPKCDKVELFMSWICDNAEFTEQTEATHPGIAKWQYPPRQRLLSVPFVPHDVMLEQFWHDGMTDAFLDDDLDALRERYCRPVVPGKIGFIGAALPYRTRLANAITGVEFYWSDGNNRLEPDVCLGRVSECDAVLHLPGDTWKCARQLEAVLLGRPLIQKRGLIDVTPALDDSNTILIDEWTDMEAARKRLPESVAIVAEADRCYKSGWSLKGQIETAIKMVTE